MCGPDKGRWVDVRMNQEKETLMKERINQLLSHSLTLGLSSGGAGVMREQGGESVARRRRLVEVGGARLEATSGCGGGVWARR